MAIQTPGAFFLGTLVPSEQKFIKRVLYNAKKENYTKLVEPAAGAFALSHLAAQVGFKPQNIEASDVILFSSVYGYAIMDKPLDDLEIKINGFTKEELKDPVNVMYAIIYYKTWAASTNELNYSLLVDIVKRRDQHKAKIKEYIDAAKKSLSGFKYSPMDMYDHLREVKHDPNTIIVLNPPTYKAGFEKWYDSKGNIEWKEPKYNIFDPKTGLIDLMQNELKDAKATVICYEETTSSKVTAGVPVFARYGVRKGVNVYLTTNKPEVIERLSKGKTIARPEQKPIDKLNYKILPEDYEITERSKISVIKITPSQAFYYRSLWTHNFVSDSGQINVLLSVDGYVVGVFGYQLSIGKRLKDILIMYGMTQKHEQYRLNRLLTMVACSRFTLEMFIPEIILMQYDRITTTQMTKYPESKEMRGIMKLVERRKGNLGYKLIYKTDIKKVSYEEIIVDFLKREQKWRKAREKYLNGAK